MKGTQFRYQKIRPQLTTLRKKIIGKCERCLGDGFVAGKKIRGIVVEVKPCICKPFYEEKCALLIANMPPKRLNILSQKFNDKKVLNSLTKKKVSLKKAIKKFVLNFDKLKEEGIGLIFYGDPGTGKTTAALKIMAILLGDRINCHYIYFKDLIGLLIESYKEKDKAPMFREITSVDLLVIDELSLVSRVTSHMVAEFTSLCKQRLEAQQPTIIIANYGNLDEIYQNFDSPMESLINEAFIPFKFYGKDLREDKFEHMKAYFE